MPIVIADVTADVLDLGAHLAAVETPRAGATTSFVGTVRDHDPEVTGEVTLLSYSAHPDAPRIMREICERVLRDHDPDGVAHVAVTHRIGDLAVGEKAVVAAVSSPHRALAFALCSAIVEEIKRSLPVWKKQHNAAGETIWSGLT